MHLHVINTLFELMNFGCVSAAPCDHHCPPHASCHTFPHAAPCCFISVATTGSAPPNLYPTLKYTVYTYATHTMASLQALVCQGQLMT